MAKKTPIDKFSAAIHDILAEYGEDISENVGAAVAAVTKKGAQAVKQNSRAPFGGTGEYAAGWTSRIDTGRMSTQGVIYNKKPGLPHLLENGHAKRGGGRVSGRVHIKPVEETMIAEFEKAVKESA